MVITRNEYTTAVSPPMVDTQTSRYDHNKPMRSIFMNTEQLPLLYALEDILKELKELKEIIKTK